MKKYRKINAGLCVISTFSALLLSGAAQAALNTDKIGVVGAVNPLVSLKPQKGATKTIKINHPVMFEDTIITDANGNTQVIFADKSTVTVGPNSSLVIDKFVYDPATSQGEMTLKAVKGTLRFIGGALSKKEAVEIKTPSATIGIRGGITMIEHNASTGGTDATFVYGEEMTLTGLNGETVSTTVPGSAISVPQFGAAPTPPVKVNVQQLSRKNNMLNVTAPAGGGAEDAPTEDKIDQLLGTSEDSDEAGENEASSGDGDSGNQSNTESAGSSEQESESQTQDTASDDASGVSADTQEPESADAANVDQDTETAGSATDVIAGEAIESDGLGMGIDGSAGNTQIAALDTGANDTVSTEGLISDITTTTTETNRESTVEERNQEIIASTTDDTPDENGNTTTDDNRNTTGEITDDTTSDDTTSDDTNDNASSGTGGGTTGGGNPPLPQPITGERLQFIDSGTKTPGLIAITRESDTNTGANAFNIELQDVTGTPLSAASNAYLLEPGTTGFSRLDDGSATDTQGNVYNIATAPIDIDGVSFDRGAAFVGPSQSMYAYYLRQDAGAPRYHLVFGRQMEDAEKTALSGIDFFDALPNLNDAYFGAYSSEDYGFFVYTAADDGLLNNFFLDTTLNDAPNYGLAVDWDNQQFISGEFDPISSISLKLAFGSVNVGNNVAMQGNVYHFALDDNIAETPKFGVMRVNSDRIYGSSDGEIDGFMVGGILTNDPAENTDTNIDNAGFLGERFRQPMVRDTAETNGPGTVSRSSREIRGFAAGIVRPDTAMSGDYVHYKSSDISQVSIQTDEVNSTISASIEMQDVTGVAQEIKGDFGNAARSVYITDDGYAAAQRTQTFDPAGTPDERVGQDVNGFIVSGNAVSTNAALECSACDFVHWGIWAAEIKRDDINAGSTDYMPAIPYVAGDPTQDLSLGTLDGLGVVNYTGKTFGVKDYGNNTSVYTQGDFAASVDIPNRKVLELDLVQSGAQYGFDANVIATGVPIATTGDATFNADLYEYDGMNYSGGIKGTTHGALFGPNAENIGGNYHVNTGTELHTGVYYGVR